MKRGHWRRAWLVFGLAVVWTVGALPMSASTAHAARGWGVRDRDRDGIPDYRDRDRDGDGIRNSRDRYPNVRSRNGTRYYRDRYGNWQAWGSPRSQERRSRRARDMDRDGIPDYRDRDRDGDGIPNSRDRYPNRPSGSRASRVNYDWDGDGVLNWNDHYPRDRRRR